MLQRGCYPEEKRPCAHPAKNQPQNQMEVERSGVKRSIDHYVLGKTLGIGSFGKVRERLLRYRHSLDLTPTPKHARTATDADAQDPKP